MSSHERTNTKKTEIDRRGKKEESGSTQRSDTTQQPVIEAADSMWYPPLSLFYQLQLMTIRSAHPQCAPAVAERGTYERIRDETTSMNMKTPQQTGANE